MQWHKYTQCLAYAMHNTYAVYQQYTYIYIDVLYVYCIQLGYEFFWQKTSQDVSEGRTN